MKIIGNFKLKNRCMYLDWIKSRKQNEYCFKDEIQCIIKIQYYSYKCKKCKRRF